MNEPEEHVDQDSSLSTRRVMMGIVGVAIVACAIWGFSHLFSQKKHSDDALKEALADNAELQKQMANLQATVADIKMANLYEQEQQTLAKDELSVILDRTHRINPAVA